MLKNKIETEVLEIMARKLVNDDLQKRAASLLEAVNLIKQSSNIFENAGLTKQSNNLGLILDTINNTLLNNKTYSFKKIVASLNEDFNYIKIDNDDLMNLDFGDINLSDDELLELESNLLNEIEQEKIDDLTFEDEIN